MPSLPTDTLKQIGNIWRRLSAPGRLAVAATMVLAVGGLLFVTFWARTPSYVVLESELDSARASKIADALEGLGIKVETRDRSTTILVPAQDASRARLKLAGLNLIASPGSIDDEKATPWEGEGERLARRIRRLQVELATTISGFEGIDRASVIISAGRDSPFASRQRPPSAAVHVKAEGGRTIGALQVKGIVGTVANAVPGLTEENVKVTGADGRLLTRSTGGADSLDGGDTLGRRAGYERDLEKKVEAILDRACGPGHYSVAVVMEMSFDSKETRSTTYDDDGKVLQTKDVEKSTTPRGDVSGSSDTTTAGGGSIPTEKTEKKNEIYMVPETTTTEVKKTPEIKRITAGITIDESSFTGDLTKLQSVLENALGIQTTRGDDLTVTTIPFAEIEYPDVVVESEGFEMDTILELLKYVAAGLVGLGLLMFFRSVLKAKPGVAGAAQTGTHLDLTIGDDDLDLPEERVSPKVLERRKVKKEIARAIDLDPRGVAKLVEMWLDEEGA